MLLSDLSPDGMAIYTSVSLTPGQEISLCLKDPQEFEIKGQVAWCQAQTSTYHIVSANPFSYRVGLALSFSTPEQAKAFADFCQQMSDEYNAIPTQTAQAA